MYLKLISIKSVRPCRRWFLKSEDISRGDWPDFVDFLLILFYMIIDFVLYDY